MRHAVAGLCILVVAAWAVGCGGGRADSPRAAAEALHAACRAGGREAVLACFSAESRQKIVELEQVLAQAAGTEGFVDTLIANAKGAEVVYGEERVQGDEATLEYTADGVESAMHFVREGGAWKVHLPITDEQMATARKRAKDAERLQKLGKRLGRDRERDPTTSD